MFFFFDNFSALKIKNKLYNLDSIKKKRALSRTFFPPTSLVNPSRASGCWVSAQVLFPTSIDKSGAHTIRFPHRTFVRFLLYESGEKLPAYTGGGRVFVHVRRCGINRIAGIERRRPLAFPHANSPNPNKTPLTVGTS